MRTTRRRHRTLDPLASPEAVRAICDELRKRLPLIIPVSQKELKRLLYSVRHVERHPASDTLRGRPSRRRREDLMSTASHLRSILERETQGRVSVSSFIGQYLEILNFPPDLTVSLRNGEINLHEAGQLARMTTEKLGCSMAEARARRCELVRSHLAMQGSQTRLRLRVKEVLGENIQPALSSESIASVVIKVDEMLEINPSDTRHLFWEEMKQLFFAMRGVEEADLDDELLDQFLTAVDRVSNVLHRIEKRRRERQKQENTNGREIS